MANKYYRVNGHPRRCHKCEGIKFKVTQRDYVGRIPCVFEYTCKGCGHVVAAWVHGSFDPEYTSGLWDGKGREVVYRFS